MSAGHSEPLVECPYCGVKVTLPDASGQWVQTCTRTEGHQGRYGMWIEPHGCGRVFVVSATRRVVHTAKARKIEGES